MATKDPKSSDFKDISVEEKLRLLYEMQKIDSEIDKIKIWKMKLRDWKPGSAI